MKHTRIYKMTVYLLLTSILLIMLNACGQNSVNATITDESQIPNENAKEQIPQSVDNSTEQLLDEESVANIEAEKAYENFLAGNTDAQDLNQEISDGVVTIKDISLEPDYKTYYALFDMNGDGIPELHLRPGVGGSYVIFTYMDGQIVLWHNGPDYESPLNNSAILYQRDGAAPTHINYYYLVLDPDGNEVSKVYFSKYHSVEESGTTESTNFDVFMYEDKEVSEEEWNSLTKDYLSSASDLIIWKE